MSSLLEHAAALFGSRTREPAEAVAPHYKAAPHWEALPDDVWQHVMTMMPVSAVASCSQTSKFWRHLAGDEHIWEALCQQAGIAQRWPRRTWKASLKAQAAWKHLEGHWDIHWNQKFNRRLLHLTGLLSPHLQVHNSIHAKISHPRFVHLEGAQADTAFVFHMTHEQSKRTFTYVISPMQLRECTLADPSSQVVLPDGTLRDMFSVQVLRHEDNVWYKGYLLRADSPAARYTAEELNKCYSHRESLRPVFEAAPDSASDDNSDSDADDNSEEEEDDNGSSSRA